jgi:hypothetical protein
LQDIAQAISNSLDRYGSGGMLAPLNMSGFGIANAGVVQAGGLSLSGNSEWGNNSATDVASIILTGGGGLYNGGANVVILKNDATPNERIRVGASGVVTIGGARGVTGEAQGSGNLRVLAASAGGHAITTYDTQNYTATQFTRAISGVTTQVGAITCTDTGTSYGTISDERKKGNFRPFDSGSILDALWVGEFDWIGCNKVGHGVRAQQAHTVWAEAITMGSDNKPWEADYSSFVPLLLNEVKALRQRVAALEAGEG